MKMVKIFIDPGHGGSDPGAVGNGLQEKNVTFQIATLIQRMLNEYQGVSIQMSRTGDQTLSLAQRTAKANAWGADFFLSIHINAGGGTGYEDYIYSSARSSDVTNQNLIHEEVMKQIDLTDRGKKRANFHVLRESRMAALLSENGFIDTAADAAKLKSASYLERIARGHVNGLARIFNLKKKVVLKGVEDLPLTIGDRGEGVKIVHQQLYALGYISEPDRDRDIFDNFTAERLKMFQKDQKIRTQNGVYNYNTAEAFARVLAVYHRHWMETKKNQ
jgi:N-acetylmuramoyl-L-alanine amidase